MSVITPLPTPPQSTDPANFDTRADAFMAALPTMVTELNAFSASVSPIGRNLLINGGFQIHQRAIAATTDGNYTADRWYVLTQTGAVAPLQLSDPEDGYINALQITQSQASAQRMGIAQVVEGANCKFARGQPLCLSGRVKCSSAITVHYAILEWSGTEDTVTRDVVNNWASGVYTPGNFFNSTTLDVVADGSIALSANTWTTLTEITDVASSAFKNLIVFVWTETAVAQNVTLAFDYMQLEVSATASPFEYRPKGIELQNCLRYCWVIRPIGGSQSSLLTTFGNVSQQTDGTLRFPVPLRTQAPVLTYSGAFGAADLSIGGGLIPLNGISGFAFGFGPTNCTNYSVDFQINTGVATFTSGHIYVLYADSDANAYIKFDAEI